MTFCKHGRQVGVRCLQCEADDEELDDTNEYLMGLAEQIRLNNEEIARHQSQKHDDRQ